MSDEKTREVPLTDVMGCLLYTSDAAETSRV